MKDAYAHRDGHGGKPHLLSAHLRDVATLAKRFAEEASPKDDDFVRFAWIAGWLHDLGKYRPAFQEYLFGKRASSHETRHAVFGAAAALSRFPSVAFAILGHHAGLHDFSDLKDAIKDEVLKPLNASPELLDQLESARLPEDFPWNASALEIMPSKGGGLHVAHHRELKARMLFSCLVDADYLDTELYMTGKHRQPVPFDAASLLDRLSDHISQVSAGAEPSVVNDVRRHVYKASVDAAELPPGCFSLTAPTGSGKTLAAMAFALNHAKIHGLRRVIVVLPFLAIIEQNARVYRSALNRAGEPDVVLEHHSAVADNVDDRPDDDSNARVRAKQATENWDAPVIVTTAVQFLESLFARRPGRCRKLHNIARSVVVFDEVQTLPFPLLDPILSALRDLRDHFGVTSLLCSATSPTFAKSANLPSGFPPGECKEVIDEPTRVFSTLRRVRLELPFLTQGKWSWDTLSSRLKDEPKALVIVNLRKHAQILYNKLNANGFESLFHLSSTMCPAHRESVLGHKIDPAEGTIYRALKGGKCLVVSTQVIEAGVDIDFPIVYRVISPMDSVIQAAGRCDREGDMTRIAGSPAGRVVVFEQDVEHATPPGFYSTATADTKRFLEEYASDPDQILDDPDIFARFHAYLIAQGEGREVGGMIQEARNRMNFKQVADLFKVIDQAGKGVVVPYREAEDLLEKIRSKKFVSFDDRRELQRYTVSLMPNWIDHFQKGGMLRPLIDREDDGVLQYIGGGYHDALGLPVGELPAESYYA